MVDRLVQATAHCMTLHGLDGFTTHQVADEAGARGMGHGCDIPGRSHTAARPDIRLDHIRYLEAAR